LESGSYGEIISGWTRSVHDPLRDGGLAGDLQAAAAHGVRADNGRKALSGCASGK